MDYLIRFIQMHESFRQLEIEALAELHQLQFEWLFYSNESPFAIIRFINTEDPEGAAKSLISRSILSLAIHELWGIGTDYPTLHADVRHRTQHLWPQYLHSTFRFEIDAFHGSHSQASQRAIIESFSYTAFQGAIRMHNPDNQFTVFEDYTLNTTVPKRVYHGRRVAESGRKAVTKYSLKKRRYIATTSMDAELSLVTANLTLAAPGKLVYDPFMGTGSFPLACAHFGASVFGSDLDGRSIRGKPDGRNVHANFTQYGTSPLYLGGFVADLTNTPVRAAGRGGGRLLDAIICDPPYGVREGLKVLGSTRAALQEVVYLSDGTPAHLSQSYVPPKKPYSFVRMLDDVLAFAAGALVDGGRLCMWMPVAGATAEDEGEEEGGEEYAVPLHPALELVGECTQQFSKWSRRLLTYRRLQDSVIDHDRLSAYQTTRSTAQNGTAESKGTADDLNDFRRKYFQGFRDPTIPRKHERLPHTF
ncbi:hypothetical protein BDY17DRAFT_315422 [Neohortaea acidophila]|uniref:tRNA (guanine(10)-N(2))-methyltransferase n=1 Tax=Neohortaea acidophila TaxID=245834 RepID=A0A6A6Q2L2_9PEZI|nr:uncharacterized protein BDY17DRAFT_315422 [Neohortaea acidophila]KAF2486768.1 hypothetical protein BDY17DRAFT_315422 [Neohortaea acidophila]